MKIDFDSKDDKYMICPNCNSFNLYRDVRDGINSCHNCGFTHFVGRQTIREAINQLNELNDHLNTGNKDES